MDFSGPGDDADYDPFMSSDNNEGYVPAVDDSAFESNPIDSVDADNSSNEESPVEVEEVVDEFAIIKEWNIKRRSQLSDRETQENNDRLQIRETAKQAILKDREQREQSRITKKQSNRTMEFSAQEAREAETSYENPFERVVNLVDLSLDSEKSDTSRMKSVLIRLKDKPLSETRS